MNLTLIANPPDAPCCVKIEREDGKSVLIQTDYDFPGVASNYGWTTIHAWRKSTLSFDQENDNPCDGAMHTDGTIDCPKCGKSASSFIAEAREFIDNNDGAEISEDPGYFED